MTSINRPQFAWTRNRPAAQPSTGKHLSLFQLLKQTFTAWSADNCVKLAAALACYAVLSLAPLVVITFKVVSLIFQGDRGKTLITQQMQNLMGSAASPQLLDNILQSSKQHSGLVATIISVAVLLFGASGVFGELQSSMNIIWQVRPKPDAGILRWLRARFLSMTMVLGLGFLLLISLFATTFITSLSHTLLGDNKTLGIILDAALSLGFITLLLAMIYKFLPDVKIAWKSVWTGAFVSAIFFVIGKFALSLYFQYGAPTSAYGVFGSLAAVIIWVYYSAQILFFGAEFTKIYARSHGHPLAPKADALPAKQNP